FRRLPHRRRRLSTKQALVLLIGIIVTSVLYLYLGKKPVRGENEEYLGPKFAIEYVSRNLEESFKLEKGTGCDIPKLNPFSKDITQFDEKVKKIDCSPEADWVKCYMSSCQVTSNKLIDEGVYCLYQDVIYINDYLNSYSSPVLIKGGEIYNLTVSDHVKISCARKDSVYNKDLGRLYPSWTSTAAGVRSEVPLIKPKANREDAINVIVIGFDSISRNMFLRKAPKSYNYLTHDLNAVVMHGYNIVGDGTPEALFPFLSGKSMLAFSDSARSMLRSKQLRNENFIFHQAEEDGYRTLYFEDSPRMHTFQKNFIGFLTRPTHHYLRPLLTDYQEKIKFCVGDTPQYKWMLNLTHQFIKQKGKKFGFTFMVGTTHDDLNLISTMDDDFLDFLRVFKEEGRTKDTLLIVMSDHGPRFVKVRNTYQGRIEERLPLLAMVLPEKLIKKRPEVRAAVEANAKVLTTPFDIYATMLDAMDLTQHWNLNKVKGATLPISLSVFRPLPRNRTCSEAGIQSHFCSCFKWANISSSNPMYHRAANALVNHINALTMNLRYCCALRILTSIEWVLVHIVNKKLISMEETDRYFPNFIKSQEVPWDLYQVRIQVLPGKSDFEGTLKYMKKFDKFIVNTKEISRTNA
ncbi:uncharacterized protein LOC113228796, partial [Hyposmocoma kahamanoa]|uniref:uncharacterized protein LOC113228796 n=1 Tax=Hyposmocoma kahamanoa TaxID=1477025 RepID=UPI000E6D67DF